MESSILKSRAALALNEILATDHVDYRSMERSRLCFFIQDYHNNIEKEVALALLRNGKKLKIMISYLSLKSFLSVYALLGKVQEQSWHYPMKLLNQ